MMNLVEKRGEMLRSDISAVADAFRFWNERELDLMDLDLEERFIWAEEMLPQISEWMSTVVEEGLGLKAAIQRWGNWYYRADKYGISLKEWDVNSYQYCRQTYRNLKQFKSYVLSVRENAKEINSIVETDDDVDVPTKEESIISFLQMYVDTMSADELESQLQGIEILFRERDIGYSGFVMASLAILHRLVNKTSQKRCQRPSDGFYYLVDSKSGYQEEYNRFLDMWKRLQHQKNAIPVYDSQEHMYLTENDLIAAIDFRKRISPTREGFSCLDYHIYEEEIEAFLLSKDC